MTENTASSPSISHPHILSTPYSEGIAAPHILYARTALSTPYGEDIAALFAAIQQKKTAAQTLPHCLGAHASGHLAPIQAAIVPALNSPIPLDRVCQLLSCTLVPLFKRLMSCQAQTEAEAHPNFIPEKTLILIVLPSKHSIRAQQWSEGALRTHLLHCEPSMAHTYLGFLSEEDAGVSVLEQCKTWLNSGRFTHIIFGGVDSLVNLKAIKDLSQKTTLRKLGEPEGKLVAEGAVFLVFQAHTLPIVRTHAQGKALNSDDPLCTAHWITDRSLNFQDEQRWYSFIQTYPDFRNITELNTQKWLGCFGAAHFPLQLALGLFWLNTGPHAVHLYRARGNEVFSLLQEG